MKLVAINERGRRIGEGHNMAKLSDHDVELIFGLLDEREKIIKRLTEYGLCWREIERALFASQLSYAGIGEKFEVTKGCIWRISVGHRRGQYPARWKRIPVTEGKADKPCEVVKEPDVEKAPDRLYRCVRCMHEHAFNGTERKDVFGFRCFECSTRRTKSKAALERTRKDYLRGKFKPK